MITRKYPPQTEMEKKMDQEVMGFFFFFFNLWLVLEREALLPRQNLR